MTQNRLAFDSLVVVLACGLLSLFLGGCAKTTGWQFGIGVFPVSEIHNEQRLTPAKGKVARRLYTAEEKGGAYATDN